MMLALIHRALLLSTLLCALLMVWMGLSWDRPEQTGAHSQTHGEQEGMHGKFTPCEWTGWTA